MNANRVQNNYTLLITGGAGFIGSHVVRHFVTKHPQYHIINLDKLTYAGNLNNLRDIEGASNYEFVHGDVGDIELVRRLFGKYQIRGVIHLAAESHVDRSISNPMAFARTNVMGTLALLEAAREAWKSLPAETTTRFHHVSTDEVYGSLGMSDEPFTETTRYAPHSPYSASKAASDHFVQAYHDTYGLPTVITNCSNNYGAYQYPEKLIPLCIHNICEEKPLPIYGKGENVRDWLHVQDHVEAIDAIYHRGKNGQSYNIGGNCELKNIDLVKMLIRGVDEQLGRAAGSSDHLITYVTDRAGHDLRYAMNANKLQKELGWKPRIDFETGLRDTIAWYLSHREWCTQLLSPHSQTTAQQP